MDILAGMLAYVTGIGALFAGLAMAFFVFVATPKAPPQAQSEPQSAHALLARPSAPNRPTAVAAHARRSAIRPLQRQSAGYAALRLTRPTTLLLSVDSSLPGIRHPCEINLVLR